MKKKNKLEHGIGVVQSATKEGAAKRKKPIKGLKESEVERLSNVVGKELTSEADQQQSRKKAEKRRGPHFAGREVGSKGT